MHTVLPFARPPRALARRFALCLALISPSLLAAQLLRIETIKSEPFGFESPSGAGGMMFEIGNLIASRAGLPSRNVVVPYARTIVSLREGTADMVLRFTNDELALVAYQIGPVLPLTTVVVGTARSPYKELADLAGATVAVSRSFPMNPRLSSVKDIRFQMVDSNEKALQMLFAGRVDAIYGSNFGIFGAAQKRQIQFNDLGKPIVLDSQPFWLHVSRKTATPALLTALRAALASAQRDGSIEQIWQRYSNAVRDAGDPLR